MENSIEIASVSEETTAWTRRINIDFNGKRVYLRLYWNEWDGYESNTPDYQGSWEDHESKAFWEWLNGDTDGNLNLAILDDMTSDLTLPKEAN